MSIDWHSYETDGFWDELITASGRARKGAGNLCRVLEILGADIREVWPERGRKGPRSEEP